MLWRHQKSSPDLEPRTQQIGHDLLTATRAAAKKSGFASSDRLMNWALQNHDFKIQLFRFIDVFPVLKSPESIHQHLLEYLQPVDQKIELPPGMSLALKAGGLLKGTLAHTITAQIQSMAKTFIAGDSLSAALPALHSQWQNHIAFSVDLLGEAVVSHAEAAIYQKRYLDLIENLPAATQSWPANPLLESDHLGSIPRTNVSIKISALDGHVSPVAAEDSLHRLVTALAPLLTAARKHNVLINFDMEHHALKELTIALFKKCCEQFQFPAGLALQAYLQSADEDAQDLLQWSREKNRTITLRLIKGAYWDFETIHAELMNWPTPVWPTKPQTDACFERLTNLFLQHTPRTPNEPGIKLALGTHNIRSIAHALASLEHHHLPNNALEFQSLRGMADDLKSVLAQRGYRNREYVPIGPMIPGMSYLVRRLLENTSNESWLRADHAAHTPDDQLLAPPTSPTTGAVTGAMLPATTSVAGSMPPGATINKLHPSDSSSQDFHNEPWRNFSQQTARDAFAKAIQQTPVPQIQNNTTLDQMNHAVESAQNAFHSWRSLPQSERSAILQKTAALMREHRDQLTALILKESQKTWPEADADLCEAIDFCNYYAQQAQHPLTEQPLSHLAGESNHALHTPRGPTAVIAPWNFPLAITTGMTVAALVTGNPVLLKPAEQTPAIAHALCQLLWQAGIPKDILHFLPGQGELIGAALVRHPGIPTIAFTGSKAVGLNILHAAATASAGGTLPFIKRVICEMGGKNAIIIDDSADPDDAILAVRLSAFSYAGQKCSACSRLILLDQIHDPFLTRLIESTRSLTLGSPEDPATDIPPVIDDEAAKKILTYIELGKSEATLVHPLNHLTTQPLNRLLTPHLFTNVPPNCRIATEEIFGPVLSVFRAKNFEEALALANSSPCKLTGGLFSRTPSHIALARKNFLVGNLYINRPITGALVSRQPFGGFALSGVGAKAGGPHYLLQFLDPRTLTESTLRRGFAPDTK